MSSFFNDDATEEREFQPELRHFRSVHSMMGLEAKDWLVRYRVVDPREIMGLPSFDLRSTDLASDDENFYIYEAYEDELVSYMIAKESFYIIRCR